jgi:hypothetical protein
VDGDGMRGGNGSEGTETFLADAYSGRGQTKLRGTTNRKLDSAGVELGTLIIGLAVLAFALGFFNLFLVHVYPLIGG